MICTYIGLGLTFNYRREHESFIKGFDDLPKADFRIEYRYVWVGGGECGGGGGTHPYRPLTVLRSDVKYVA